jgi:hypothetical protein
VSNDSVGACAPTSRGIYFGFDHHSWAGVALATTLWLQGYPAQAAACAHEALKDAERAAHPVSLAIVTWFIPDTTAGFPTL